MGKGKSSATAGNARKTLGTVKVTPTLVSGETPDITSYEPGKGMGKVDIKVAFSAKS